MIRKIISMIVALVMTISGMLGQMILPSTTIKAAANTLIIHYGGREDGDYEGWNLWVWEEGKDGKQIDFREEDSFGKIAVVSLSKTGKVGFIVRKNDWEAKDIEKDRFVETKDGVTEIWVTSNQEKFTDKAPEGAKSFDFEADQKQRQDVYKKKDALKLDVHFYGFGKKYKDMEAYVHLEGEDGGSYRVQKKDKFGGVFQVGLMNRKKVKTAGLMITLPDGSNDCDSERIIDLSMAKKNKLSVYIVQGNKEVYYKKSSAVKSPVISEAKFVSASEIEFQVADTMNTAKEDLVDKMKLTDQNGTEYKLLKVWSKNPGVEKKASLIIEDEVDFSNSYTIHMEGHVSSLVSISEAFSTEEFEEAFTYTGDDLGAVYTAEKTSFRVWAPTASEVSLNLYKEGIGDKVWESLPMLKDEKGTWVHEAIGDYLNIYYTYSVTVDGITQEAVDPYAKAVGVNGQRGMVIDLKATDPEGFEKEERPKFKKATDAIIYELHVRDLSSDTESGIQNTGKFLGLAETGTVNGDNESTGLDHIKDLGVTHVHLLPSFDYASVDESKSDNGQFNWGYDPQNYNVPEGSYSTDATDGNVRVKEYKEMVQKLHENGIRVIMDVVYNHTYNIEDSNFQKIVPDYYYRKDGENYSNGSGCGNETASERSMMRKFMVDSVVYWATEYHVDGFRFDLMGVHDIDTMNEIRMALDEIDPSIMIYGEGWTGGDSVYEESARATKANIAKLDGIAAFSDDFRDGLKGNVFDEKDKGFVTGNDAYMEDVKLGIVAATEHSQIDTEKLTKSEKSWALSPSQCINYVSCHDNLTLWDKIATSNPGNSKKKRIAMNKLAASMVLTAQGIPFFQAGEELLRSKPAASGEGFDANSYRSPDSTNSIKWSTKTANKEVYEYYKGLIAFRKAHGAFRMTKTQDIQDNLVFLKNLKGNAIGYTITGSPNGEKAKEIMVVHNGNNKNIDVQLPDTDVWKVYINGEKAGTQVLAEAKDTITVDAISTIVLVKEENEKALQGNSHIAIWVMCGVIAVIFIAFAVIGWKRKNKKNK